MKLKKLVAMTIALLFVQTNFAAHLQDEPNACPSLSALKSVGLQLVFRDTTWGWMGISDHQQYDTNVKWTFGIFIPGQVTDQQDALVKGTARLAQLDQVQGPLNMGEHNDNRWGCFYSGGEDNVAIAFTPTLDAQQLMSFAKQFRN